MNRPENIWLPMSKPFTVQHTGPLSISILVVGFSLFVVGMLDLMGIRFGEVGAWGYWLCGIGVILMLIGAIWFASYRINVRKFEKLMDEKSKAVFVKKIEDVEYLAWKLPSNFEERLQAKKKDFGMK